MYVQLANIFFVDIFVNACAHKIKQKLDRKTSFHLDTTEGFERNMYMALKELKEFYTETERRFKMRPTRKFFNNKTKHEKKRIRDICELINELQDANKGTFSLKPTKHKVVAKEIQKLEKIRQFLVSVRCDLVGYFRNYGFELNNIDNAIYAIQGYQNELNSYITLIKDYPERAGLPPKWSTEALLAVKEVFSIIGKIGNRKDRERGPLCNYTTSPFVQDNCTVLGLSPFYSLFNCFGLNHRDLRPSLDM